MKKNSTILNNENAFALISTLLFGILSIGLLLVAFLMVSSSAKLAGTTKRYAVELDTAKGAAGYVMAELRNTTLTCVDSTTACIPSTATLPLCSPNAQIFLPSTSICDALGKPGCAGLSACFLSSDVYVPPAVIPPDPDITFYSVQVTSTNTIGETSTIDFVYKVE